MTISSLTKFIAGVNRMVVENVEIESPEINPMADSLMEEISLFVEENCEAEILEETREIR